MIVDERKVFVYWRIHESSYAYANRDGLEEAPRVIGSSVSAVNKMLGNSEEQQILMQSIIGVSPNNEFWAGRLSNYWHSISEDVQSVGRELEVGFVYDIKSVDKRIGIDLVNSGLKDGEKINTDQDILDYFNGRLTVAKEEFNKSNSFANKLAPVEREKKSKLAYNIYYDAVWNIESERYKFGRPINTVDYMLYRYCLVYSHVANSFEAVSKSPNIRFYLHSEADIQRAKEAKHKMEKDRMTTYIKVISSPTKVENILYAMGKGDLIKEMDETDQFLLLESISKDNSKRFVAVASDKNLTTRGLIEKYISYSLIRRLPGSQVIVDSADPSITIGNSVTEAVTYFTNKKNEAIVTEYSAKFKGLA